MAFVAGGEAHSGAIDKRGRVYMWGAGDSGRLGFPDTRQKELRRDSSCQACVPSLSKPEPPKLWYRCAFFSPTRCDYGVSYEGGALLGLHERVGLTL